MKYKKALVMFQGGIMETNCEMKKDLYETAIAAIEMQIPKKPIDKGDRRTFLCPSCKLEQIDARTGVPRTFPHCPNCGQRLDWRKNNE